MHMNGVKIQHILGFCGPHSKTQGLEKLEFQIRLYTMPPPSPTDHKAFHLNLLENPFFVKQLKLDENIPPEYLKSLTDTNSKGFISITRTDEEISIVGEVVITGDETKFQEEEANWRCIKIAGPMDFGLHLTVSYSID